ncbi:MAG: 6-bladed beta-propeller [Acidobacteriota bacterium]
MGELLHIRRAPLVAGCKVDPVLLGVLAMILGFAGCGPAPSPTESNRSWKGTQEPLDERSVRVVNEAGSLWSGDARLAEELSIGVVEGAEEYMLGGVSGLARTAERLYVADRSVPVVRVYDAVTGKHLDDVGRRGSGPGEFQSPLGIGTAADGRLFVRDQEAYRIVVFGPRGDPLDVYPMRGGFKTVARFVVTFDGTPYSPGRVSLDGNPQWYRGMVPYGPRGQAGEVLVAPHGEGFEPPQLAGPGPPCVSIPVPYAPEHVWAMGVDGSLVGGISDSYSFTIRRADGTEIHVEKQDATVPFDPDERAYHRRYYEAAYRFGCGPAWSWNGPDVPRVKPAFRAFLPQPDGGLWVLRHGRGERLGDSGCDPDPDPDGTRPGTPCWSDALIVDAFAPDGRYRGRVRLPGAIEAWSLERVALLQERALFVPVMDAVGTIRVKRYRLEAPSDPESP